MTEIQQADAREARALTDRIKIAVEGTWQLIQEAYLSRAWAALGYASWDEYCTREFGTSRLRLPREERQEVVASLRDSGLSTRAIAAAAGLARNTVRDDLRQVGQSDPPAQVKGADGKSYIPSRPSSRWVDNPESDEIVEDDGEPPAPSPAVTEYLADDQAAKDISYVRSFLSALQAAGKPTLFDPDRVGQLLDETEFRLLRMHADSITRFTDKAERARRGLRVVQGGRQ